MSITYKSHGFHSDTKTVHTLCGEFAEDRDLLMRKFLGSNLMLTLVFHRSTAWIVPIISKIAIKGLLGKKCLDCKRRSILFYSEKGSICFCMDRFLNT
jgi:hypothetical protein